MILINCTNMANKNIINENYINIRTISIEFSNKMLMDDDLIRTITDFTEPLLHQEKSVLFILNALDEALVNMENDPDGQIRYRMFVMLLRGLISAGHEVLIYDVNGVNQEMIEISKLDGVSVYDNDVNLLKAIRETTEGTTNEIAERNAEYADNQDAISIKNNTM